MEVKENIEAHGRGDERRSLLSADSLENPDALVNGLTPEEEFKFSSTCSRLDDVYLPWTICGRPLHWSEGVLLVGFGTALAFTVLWVSGLKFPAFFYALFLITLALLSLWMVWGVASIKSFARLATALEGEQTRIENVTENLRLQNSRVHEATVRTRQQMVAIARDLGLMEGGLDQLDEVAEGLRGFNESMAESQHEQHVLNAAQREKLEREHEVHRDERARQCRDKILEWFDSAADKQVFINTPEQHRALMEILEASDLLQELAAQGKNWRARLAQICRAGVTEKWELIDMIDELADTEFYQITMARERRKELETKVERLRKDLARAARGK